MRCVESRFTTVCILGAGTSSRSEEHTSELQSLRHLVCRLLLEKKTNQIDLGRHAEAIMALVQKPLGGPIALASEHLSSPAQLHGKTVGITASTSATATPKTTER